MNALEPWLMVSPPARVVLAANLRALMNHHRDHKTITAVERATSLHGQRIGKSTVDRMLNSKTPVNLDYLETLSKVFGIAPWQMLVPDFDPSNPQVLRAINEKEAALYARMGELAKQFAELPEPKP